MKTQIQKVIRNIRTDREELGLSQMRLAQQAGCHFNTVSRLERGANVPSLAVTLRILSILEQAKVVNLAEGVKRVVKAPAALPMAPAAAAEESLEERFRKQAIG